MDTPGGGSPPAFSQSSAEGFRDPQVQSVQNDGGDSPPPLWTAGWVAEAVHRPPDRRWTPGEAGATSLFRTAAPGDSQIREHQVSERAEETVLRRFGPSVEWLKSSIAVPTGDGHPGRRVPSRLFAPQHREIRRSPSSKWPKRRRRLSSVGLDRLLGGCVRPSQSRPAMDSRGGGCTTSPFRSTARRNPAIP